MIPWVTIRPALVTLFRDIGELQTIWIDKKRPYIDPKEQAVILLRVRTTDGEGVDDRRRVDLGLPIPEATLEEQSNGHRVVGMDVRVESFRHDDDRFAFNATSSIRTRLSWTSSRIALNAINVALVRVSQVLDVTNVIQDDRVTSVAILDLSLRVGICEADTKHPLFCIETVDNPVDHPDTVISPV